MASLAPALRLNPHITPRTALLNLHETTLPHDGYAFIDQSLDHDDDDPYLLSHSSSAPTLAYSVEKRKVHGAERPVLAVLLPESDLDSDVGTLFSGYSGGTRRTKSSSRKSQEELKRIAAMLDMRGSKVWQRDSGWLQMDDWLPRCTTSSRKFQAVDQAWYTWTWRKGEYKVRDTRYNTAADPRRFRSHAQHPQCYNERHYFVASYELNPAAIVRSGILAISPSFRHLAPRT